MAISIDDSVARFAGTPATTSPITSASFTPPSGSLLLCAANVDEGGDSDTVDEAVAGGSLTWTRRIRRGAIEAGGGIASIWTAPVVTGTSMTVDVNRTTGSTGTNRISAKIYIITGQHASPIGQSNSANWTTNPQTLAITASGAGRLFGCGTDFNATGLPVSTDTEDADTYAGQISVMSAYKSADHAAGSGSQSIQFDPVGTPTGNVVVLEILAAAASAATLSSATPSGTLGTTTTATLGATTDQTTGTFYGVVDTAGNISGITAAQVKAGQNNGSVSAAAAANSAVSTSSPAAAVSGLTAATAYSYAVVQNNGNGDSNVLTGTFTTAAAALNPQSRSYGPKGFQVTLLTM